MMLHGWCIDFTSVPKKTHTQPIQPPFLHVDWARQTAANHCGFPIGEQFVAARGLDISLIQLSLSHLPPECRCGGNM